jgi:hypothetical protein
MNHLTLYLLLATDKAVTPNAVESQLATQVASFADTGLSRVRTPGIYQPRGYNAQPLCQASYRPATLKKQGASAAIGLQFTASVIANTIGYLMLTSGLLLLLHIAQASLA